MPSEGDPLASPASGAARNATAKISAAPGSDYPAPKQEKDRKHERNGGLHLLDLRPAAPHRGVPQQVPEGEPEAQGVYPLPREGGGGARHAYVRGLPAEEAARGLPKACGLVPADEREAEALFAVCVACGERKALEEYRSKVDWIGIGQHAISVSRHRRSRRPSWSASLATRGEHRNHVPDWGAPTCRQ